MEILNKKDAIKRHREIFARMSAIDEKAGAENRDLNPEEEREYNALMREHERIQGELEHMATERELEKYAERKSKNQQLREYLQNCVNKRENGNTILMNPVTEGDDKNINGNLEASGAIPLTIREMIDTKVAGLELPPDLAVVTGVVGNEIWPYSTNDVKFTVAGEVEKIGEQGLDFAKAVAIPERVAASVAVSHRAIANAAFDLLGFISYKFQKGFAIWKAIHVYSHCKWNSHLDSPFANVDVVEIENDDNLGEKIATEVAKMYNLGFEGVPYLAMDKVTETKLSYKKAIPGSTGDRTVVEDGKCVGYPYMVSPYVSYELQDGEPKPTDDRYIAVGHFGYLALQQHGDMLFNVDAQSSENFNAGKVVLSLSTDMSITELSQLVNGNKSEKPQAFKLIKIVEPASSSEI